MHALFLQSVRKLLIEREDSRENLSSWGPSL